MKTIEKEIDSEIIIKNSKFITYIFPIASPDISSYLNKVKEIHSKANHYCYGYIYDNVFHYSDDGEPSNTAGLPIYHVLQKTELNHVLAIVVRYFGGIKLGAGGLVRAYTKAVSNTLSQCNYIQLEKGYLVKITTNYQEMKNLDYILKNYRIQSKEFQEQIIYYVEIPIQEIQNIENYTHEIQEELFIQKNRS